MGEEYATLSDEQSDYARNNLRYEKKYGDYSHEQRYKSPTWRFILSACLAKLTIACKLVKLYSYSQIQPTTFTYLRATNSLGHTASKHLKA